jgi:ABC-2 type transport system ATP-binding protein
MLEVREVVKSYSGRAVVNRISFDVNPGELFALLGPNGAGKTTLIRMITDITRPDSGEILLEGHGLGDSRRPAISYLPEERGLYRRAKVQEALAFYGELRGMTGSASKKEAGELLERVGLGEWGSKSVQALSKGMQQKVQLCTALIGSPRLMILDEPFSGLDPLNVQLLEEVLQERRRAGATVLLSTHQMNRVEEFCDRALMINRGHMVLYGAVGQIRREHSENSLIVRGGDVPDGLPGVAARTVNGADTLLRLAPGSSLREVMRALLDRGVEFESVAHASMPLEDIFVKVVTEGLGLDHGESGPPTVDEALVAGGAR